MVGTLVVLKAKKLAATKEYLMVGTRVDTRGTSWDRTVGLIYNRQFLADGTKKINFVSALASTLLLISGIDVVLYSENFPLALFFI